MPAQLKYEDFINPAALSELQKFWTQYGGIVTAEMVKVKKELETHLTTLNNIRGVNSQNINTLNQVSQSVEQNKTKYQQLSAVQKEHERIKQSLERATARYTAEQSKEARQLREVKDQTRQVIKEQNLQSGSIRKLREDTNKLVKTRENLNLTTQKGQQRFRELSKEISKNTNQLKSYDTQIGRSQRNVGNYIGALKQFALAYISIYSAVRLLRSISGIIIDFGKESSRLAAILGKTKKETKDLTKNAKELGATTVFTATQVTQLQVELAKLGFTQEQILAVTEGILDMAAAAGTDLANASEIVGSTIRAFQIDVSNTRHVVDVMAKSFSTSALNIDRFRAAMSNVAPTAKKFGWSLEYTTALLGKLVDNGIEASKAGTDLRRIIAVLASKNITLEQSLQMINSSQNKVNTAQKLFGQRAFTSALILIDLIDTVDDYAEVLNKADGAAKQMAQTMLDNIAGDLTILKSAWEGLILSVEEGEGVIARVARSFVQDVTKMLRSITEFSTGDWLLKLKIAANAIQGYFHKTLMWPVAVIERITGKKIIPKLFKIEEIEKATEEAKKLAGVLTEIKDEATEAGAEGDKQIIGIINNLNAEIAKNIKLKNEQTNPAYIAFYGKEIKRLREKVKWYEGLSDALDKIAPKAAQITQDIDKLAGEIVTTLTYTPPPKESIFQKFFRKLFGLTDKQKEEIKDAARTLFNEMRDMLSGLNQQLIDLAEKRVNATEDTLNDLRDLLKEEQALKDEGKANDVERLNTQIAEENKIRAKAQADLEKFTKTQNTLNTVQEISSLVTASANIIKGFSNIPIIGTALGIAAVVAMLGSYAALKAKIGRMSKGYAEGTEYVERGNNPKGKDTIHARLNEGERVISTEDNKKLGGMSNENLVKELQYYSYYKNKLSTVTPGDPNVNLETEIKGLRKIQQEALDIMKAESDIIDLGNDKIMIKRGNYTEIKTLIRLKK